MGVHNLGDKSSFTSSVLESNDVVVIDYFATWCGPCKMIAPQIVKMSEEDAYKDVKFYKIDVDEVPEVAQEVGIRAMPTFQIFKNGEKVGEVVGANPKEIRAQLDKALYSNPPSMPLKSPPAPTNWMSYLPMLILAVLAYRYFMGA